MDNFKQLKGAKRGKHGLIPQTLETGRSPRGQPQQGWARGELGWEQTRVRNGFEAGPLPDVSERSCLSLRTILRPRERLSGHATQAPRCPWPERSTVLAMRRLWPALQAGSADACRWALPSQALHHLASPSWALHEEKQPRCCVFLLTCPPFLQPGCRGARFSVTSSGGPALSMFTIAFLIRTAPTQCLLLTSSSSSLQSQERNLFQKPYMWAGSVFLGFLAVSSVFTVIA